MTARAWNVVGAALLVAVVWVILHIAWYGRDQIVDYGVYMKYGDAIVHRHLVPYRDVRVEYPPAALLVFSIPTWLERWNYQYVFQALMAICLLAIVLAVLRLAGRRAAIAAAVAPLLLGNVVLSRYDLWPTALLALALAAAVAGRIDTSAVLTGTAFAAKLWPAVAVPFVAVWLARTYGRRAALRYLTVGVAVAAVWFIPFVVLAPDGVGYPFHQEFARPLQIESLGSSLLIVIHDLFGTSIHVIDTYGSQNVAGDFVGIASVLTTVVGAVVLVTLFVLFVRGPCEREDLLLAVAAATAALFAFGKVFSPQFLIWIFPFAWIVRGGRARFAVPAFVLALGFTQVYFPYHYWGLVNGFNRPQVVELFARNLMCLALVVCFGWPRLQHEVFGKHRSRLEALQRVRAQVE
jgi:Glycosyltransferase family 87